MEKGGGVGGGRSDGSRGGGGRSRGPGQSIEKWEDGRRRRDRGDGIGNETRDGRRDAAVVGGSLSTRRGPGCEGSERRER